MTDQQQSAGVRLKCFLQQFKRLDVKVIGGFIQYQQIGWPGKQARQQQPVTLAARKHSNRCIGTARRKQEVTQITHHMLTLAANLNPV